MKTELRTWVSIDRASQGLVLLKNGRLMNLLKLQKLRCGDWVNLLGQKLHLLRRVGQISVNVRLGHAFSLNLSAFGGVWRRNYPVAVLGQITLGLAARLLSVLILELLADLSTARLLHLINLLIHRPTAACMHRALASKTASCSRIVIRKRRLRRLEIGSWSTSIGKLALLLTA